MEVVAEEMISDDDDWDADSLYFPRSLYSGIGHCSYSREGLFFFWCGYNLWSFPDEGIRHAIYETFQNCGVYDGRFLRREKIVGKSFKFKEGASGSLSLSGACSVYCERLGSVYMFGGYRSSNGAEPETDIAELYLLDVRTNVWSKVTPSGVPPVASNKVTGWYCHLSKRIYFFGGYGEPPNADQRKLGCEYISAQFEARGWNNQLVAYDVRMNGWIWPKCRGKPPPLAAPASVKRNRTVYLFGGREAHLRVNKLHTLDLETMHWSSHQGQANWPEGRSWHTLNLCSNEHAVLFGGLSQNGEVLNDCWILDLNSLIWTRLVRPGLEPRMWHQSFFYDGVLFVHGGSVSSIMLDGEVKKPNSVQKITVSPRSLTVRTLDVIIEKEHLLKVAREHLPRTLKDLLESAFS